MQWIEATKEKPRQVGYYVLYMKTHERSIGYWNGREWKVCDKPESELIDILTIDLFSRFKHVHTN